MFLYIIIISTHNRPCGTKEAKHLYKLVLALRKEIECSPQGLVSKSASHKDDRPKLLIVDSDRQLTRELVITAETHGIVADIATTLPPLSQSVIY
jgi:hypothetical protein